MKRILFSAVPALVLIGTLIALHTRRVAPPPPLVPDIVDGGNLTVTSDAEAIYQRAFWERLPPGDSILHAERREWISEGDGVRKWQWYLEIKTCQDLAARLAGRFPLSATDLAEAASDTAPEWFRAAASPGAQVLAAADGSFTLITPEDGSRVLATGTGNGFARPTQPVTMPQN